MGNANYELSGSGTGNFNVNLTNLSPHTTYYYQTYATNAVGTTYSSTYSFTTSGDAPTLGSSSVTNITTTGATVNGNVVSDNQVPVTSRGVRWSTTTYMGNANYELSGSGMGNFSVNLTNLSPHTTYYYQTYATNAVGTTYSSTYSFTTASSLPVPTTSAASNRTSTSATLNGTISNPDNVTITAQGFQWKTTANGTYTNLSATGSTMSYNLTGLTANTSYTYRTFVTTAAGTTYGAEMTFTTLAPTQPTVTTSAATNITTASATLNGSISNPDNVAITAQGFQWKTTANGTYTNVSATGTTMSYDLTGLSVNTNYTYRAFVSSASGTIYGAERTFTTLCDAVNVFITGNTEVCAGQSTTLTAVGGTTYQWSTGESGNSITVSPEATQYYSVTVTNANDCSSSMEVTVTVTNCGSVTSLTPCTPPSTHPAQTSSTYQNNGFSGANHGLETVTSDGKINSVTDYDGNEYPVVQIGSQCWLAENMRCTHSPLTGTYIVNNQFTSGSNIDYTYTGKMARWYDNDSATYAPKHYGLLYNWNAAVDLYNTSFGELSIKTGAGGAVDIVFAGNRKGICPKGWHVPTDEEWRVMESAVNGSYVGLSTGYHGTYAGELAAGDDWGNSVTSGSPGDYTSSSRNNSGFAAVPAGYYYSSFNNVGNAANFWSSSQVEGIMFDAWYRGLSHTNAGVIRFLGDESYGFSVRCLRDTDGSGSTVVAPTAITSPATNLTSTSATLSGTVSNPDNVTVTAQGFEWKATAGGTYTAVNATGDTITYSLTGLTANTSYTYRAFVTTASGTSYGEEVTFTTTEAVALECTPYPCSAPPASQIDNVVHQFDSTLYNTSSILYDNNGYPYIYTYQGDTLDIHCGWIYKFNVEAGSIYEWNTDISQGVVTPYGNNGIKTKITLFYDDFETPVIVSQSPVNTSIATLAAGLAWKANYTGTVGVLVTRGDEELDLEGSYCACNGDDLLLRYDKLANSPTDYYFIWGRYGTSDTIPCDDNIHYVYDSGLGSLSNNASGDYANNENGYLVLYPENETSKIKIWGDSKIKEGDTLFIYNGDLFQIPNLTPADTIVGQQQLGFIDNPIFISQTAGAPITFRMQTDESCTWDGLVLMVKCVEEPVAPVISTVYPCTAPSTHPAQTGSTYQNNGYNGANHGLETVTSDGKINSVTDYDGNEYPVVQIGSQCWLAENMRCTHSPSTGTYIVNSETNVYTYTGKMAKWYTGPATLNGNSVTMDSVTCIAHHFGLLYNWNAAVDVYNTEFEELSSGTNITNAVNIAFTGNRQGICPKGWHVPTDAEWTTMETVVNGSTLSGEGYRGSHAGKLATSEDWNNSTTSNAPGNYTSPRNSSGFSVVPSGYSSGSFGGDAGYTARLWSTTQDNGNLSDAWLRTLSYDYAGVARSLNVKSYGYSVRCLRDETVDTTDSPSIISKNPCTVPGAHPAQTGDAYRDNGYNGANHGLETLTNEGKINSVTDFDGNEYPVVQIGSQCWLAENMRCTHSPLTGTYIVNNTVDQSTYTGKMAKWYSGAVTMHGISVTMDSAACVAHRFGLLYNWNAAVDLYNTFYGELSINNSATNVVNITFSGNRQGICPMGWHVPSDAEWATMETRVNGSTVSGNSTGYRGSHAGKLAAGVDWNKSTASGTPGYYNGTRNNSGFSAVPAGIFNSSFTNIGNYAYFWTASQNEYNAVTAGYRFLYYNNTGVYRGHYYKSEGYSVRCLRDADGSGGIVLDPKVITSAVSDLTAISATLNGTISNPDNVIVTDQGFEWKTTANGTYTTVNTTGAFMSYNLTGLTESTDYTYRAFVTTVNGKVYGEEMTFTTITPCTVPSTHPAQTGTSYQNNGFGSANYGLETLTNDGKINSVTDYDGNEYVVVQIGSQCWLAENMRCTHSPKTGSCIVGSPMFSYGSKLAAWYTDDVTMNNYSVTLDSAACVKHHFGLLYNWCAAMDTANPSNYAEVATNSNSNNTSFYFTPSGNHKGICPTGWHVPTDDEWSTMESVVNGSDVSAATGSRGTHAGKLAAGNDWNNGTTAGTPGDYTISYRNSSGFSAVPAGSFSNSFYSAGGYAIFWSSSQKENNSSNAWYRELSYNNAGVNRNNSYKYFGFSVRCLRDEFGNMVANPTATTFAATNLTATSATLSGSVSNPYNVSITANGFQWKTTANGTYTNVSVTGSTMSYNLTGLTANTSYTYRAFVTTTSGTNYGEEMTFTTKAIAPVVTITSPCTPPSSHPAQTGTTYLNNGFNGANYGLETLDSDDKIISVTDYDGNEYQVVQIGSQCWLAENMRCTHAPSTGTYIVNHTINQYTYTGKMAKWYTGTATLNGNSVTMDSAACVAHHFGLLYNWNAAMDVYNTSYSELSINTDYNNAVKITFTDNRQGICPRGWHVPTDMEWSELDLVVNGSDVSYYGGTHAGKLAGGNDWKSSTTSGAPGDYTSTQRNISGFAAVPAGSCTSSFDEAGSSAYFWSSSQLEGYADRTWIRYMDYGDAGVYLYDNNKVFGFSVRCLRDTVGDVTTPVSSPNPCTPSVTHPAQTAALGYAARGVNHGLETLDSDDKIVSVTDYDGNEYPVVQIGSQCWLAENMRCTHSPSTGTYIVNNQFISGTIINYTYTGKMAKWYTGTATLSGNSVTLDSAACVEHHFGLLYNWNAAVDVYNTAYGELSINTSSNKAVSATFMGDRQGICPRGWHVPTDAEWTALEDYVSSQSNYLCSDNMSNNAKALAADTLWNSSSNTCAVGNDVNANNATGFGALPAGYHSNAYLNSGNHVYFWSTTETPGDGKSWYHYLNYGRANVGRSSSFKGYGCYVRCLRDADNSGSTTATPTAITSAATDLTYTSATLNGTISNSDNVTIMAQGFEWKAADGDTYAMVNATGALIAYNLTDLNAGTEYTYRAFVTTVSGTVYGAEMTFTTMTPCTAPSTHNAQTSNQGYTASGANHGLETVVNGKIYSVTDYDGNEYPVVQIGGQCWLAENMRCTHSPSTGTYIVNHTTNQYTQTGKMAKWYTGTVTLNGNSVTLDSAACVAHRFGLLYNWNAAVDVYNTSYEELSINTSSSNAVSATFTGNRQGICPRGWHVPTDDEWNTMEASVSGSDWQTSYETSTAWRGAHAGKLAGDNDWASSTNTGAPGNDIFSHRNVSGFSAVPVGTYSSSFTGPGSFVYFWSSSQREGSTYNAWYRRLNYSNAGVNRSSGYKSYGYSVRCLRDESGNTAATPTATTFPATNLISTFATLNGSVSNPDDVTTTAQGFEWKTTTGGTYTAVNATGEMMSYNLTGLTPNTSYTCRAFVTTASGTNYGEEVTFTTPVGIYGTGFESDEGFTAQTSYNNLNISYFGPDDQQWGTRFGAVSTNSSIFGSQSMQMRWYTTYPDINGYAFMDFDLRNATSASFSAKSMNMNMGLVVSYSIDGGQTFTGDSVYSLTTQSQSYRYEVSPTGEYDFVRLRFQLTLLDSTTPSTTCRVILDSINVFGHVFDAVETPMISKESCRFYDSLEVTITCATEDAVIRYTLDGTEPSENSTVYSGAITISNTTTLKAKAWKQGLKSSFVKKASFYRVPLIDVQNLTELRNKLNFSDIFVSVIDTVEYRITGNVIVTSKTSFRNYKTIQDGTAAIQIFDPDSVLGDLQIGDEVSGICGKLENYYGYLELVPTRTYERLENVFQNVEPLVITLTQLGDTTFMNQHQSELIILKNAILTDTANFAFNTRYNISQSGVSDPGLYPCGWYVDADYIGQPVPAGQLANITGFAFGQSVVDVGSHSTNNTREDYRYYIVPRFAEDIHVLTQVSVTTSPATNITSSSATLNGTITNPDNVAITAKGFEYKRTVNGTYTQLAGTGNGNSFTANLTGLTANTSYTYRAFITYGGNTIYGDEVTLTTIDGNVILSEDFSAITDSTLSIISLSLNDYTQMSGWTGDWIYPSNGKVRVGKSSLAGFIQTPSLDLSGNNGQYIVTFDVKVWENDTTSIVVSINDVSYTVSGLSSTEFNTFSLPIVGGASSAVIKFQGSKDTRARFFLDNVVVSQQSGSTAVPPTVNTDPATDLTQTSATLNGSVSSPDNVTVTAKGFDWKTTVGGTYTLVSGTGAGSSFTASLTGLTANTSYTYRAFVTYGGITFYGNEQTFVTLTTNPVTGTIILNENFSAITDSTSTIITSSLDSYTQMPGWTGDWVFPSTDKVKVGKSAQAGYIQTPSLNLSANNGQFVLTFDARSWTNDATSLYVVVDGTSYTVEGLNSSTFTTFSLPLTGGTSSTTIKFLGFQDSKSRFFLDNVVISQ